VTVLELVVAAATGGVVGWAGHALYRRTRMERTTPPAAEPTPVTIPVPTPHPTGPGPGPPPSKNVSEGATMAGRVILQLYAQGRLAPHEVADPEFTQEGIGRALGLRQGTVARVVGRLTAAGVLVSDRRHVTGRPRRLMVYTLTPLGESVARDLRKNSAGSSGPPTPTPGSRDAGAQAGSAAIRR